NPRNTEADIAVLNDGRLLLAWSDFYEGAMPDDAPARISAMISEDMGRTWGERFTLQENVGGQNVMSVSLLRLASGDLLFFYLVKNADDDLQIFVRRSGDDARTWSDPLMVSSGSGYHVMNNARVVQLSSGRLIAPCAWNPGTWREDGEKRNSVGLAYLSDDDGRSWQACASRLKLGGIGCQEPGVVELSDGRVMMIIRTSLGQIYRSYSADGGVIWTDPEPMGIAAPVAPSTITKIPSTGDLLLIWNDCFRDGPDAEAVRRPLTSAISRDDGETWEHRRDLETEAPYWYAYVSVTFVQDRALLTYWVHDRRPDPNLLSLKLRSLPVSWFYGE
ncbi:MAG: exo-alpha-sialidase, partial [Armatimonadetes bacterium]|nr:exo-alpha-sialidase [Armatimonadota bacterium]